MKSGKWFQNAGIASWWLRLLSLSCVIALVGCGGGGEKLVPMEGKATVNGQSLPEGIITLFQAEGKSLKSGNPTGSVGQDGSFKLMTGGKPGAPVGKFKVVLSPAPPASTATGGALVGDVAKSSKGPEKHVNPKYESLERTDLIVDVVSPPPAGGYELKFTK